MISINLLDNRRKAVLEKKLRATKANLISVSLLVMVGILTSISFFLMFYQQNRVTQAERQISQLETEIASYNEVFARLTALKSTVASIGQILATRDLASEKIDLFFEIYNAQVMNIQSVGLGGASNPLEFEISGDVVNVRQFIATNDYFRDLGERLGLDFITLQRVGRSNTGEYRLDYLIRFSDERIN